MAKKKVETIEDIKPSEMFGNPVLIKKLDEERKAQEFKKNSKPCGECNEKGVVRHDCDCKLCDEYEEECDACEGVGRVLKESY